MAARGHSRPTYRNQKAIFGNGRSHLRRHMKATGYAGWLVENWWRMPGGVYVAKHYWIEKKKVCPDEVRPGAKNGYLRT